MFGRKEFEVVRMTGGRSPGQSIIKVEKMTSSEAGG
jgi:hypothetical protein